MDVRCENCQTEYELEASRLKPSGVTVKCTACGHLFRVRRRAASGDGEQPSTRSSAGGLEQDERVWLVRLEDGEIRTCRELATLQQWIVSREVARTAEISRTGKKWKELGEIAELAEFFSVAEEARRRRASSQRIAADEDDPHPTLEWQRSPSSNRRLATAHPRLVPSRGAGERRPSVPPPTDGHSTRRGDGGKAPVEPPAKLSPSSTVQGVAAPRAGASSPPRSAAASAPPEPSASHPPTSGDRTSRGSGPVAARRESGPMAARRESGPVVASRESGPVAASADAASPGERPIRESQPVPAADREAERAAMARLKAASGPLTGQWASAREHRRFVVDEEGPTGPTGGLARGIPTDDVAFANSGLVKPPDDDVAFARGGAGNSPADDAELNVGGTYAKRRGGGAAWWILGLSLVVMGAAAAVIFAFVFRADGPGSAHAALDAGFEARPDAAVFAEADEEFIEVDPGALAAARVAVLGGDDDEMATAAEVLHDDRHFEMVVAQARLAAARAQLALDLATLETGAEARRLGQVAAEHATAATELAARARELEHEAVASFAITGEALRVSGQRPQDVRRPLRRAIADDPDHLDAQLSLALVLAGEGRDRQARRSLEELLARAEASNLADPRPRLQLALMEFLAGDDDRARDHAEKVLAMAPEHAVAREIVARLDEREAVVAEDDPMPREESPAEAAPPATYAGLLERANSLAERGRCSEASGLFRRALELDSSGVEALTGLAYCHLDAREFASAHARFDQALSISSRYQAALYGIAETYQQQGLDQRAIAAYERYLEMHPSGTRAEMAQRQIVRLGGEADPEPEARDPAPGASGGEAADDGEDDAEDAQPGDGGDSDDGEGGDDEDDEDDEPRPFLSDD